MITRLTTMTRAKAWAHARQTMKIKSFMPIDQIESRRLFFPFSSLQKTIHFRLRIAEWAGTFSTVIRRYFRRLLSTGRTGQHLHLRLQSAGSKIVRSKKIIDFRFSKENDKSEDNLEVDYSVFEEQIWPILAKRIPSFESLKVNLRLSLRIAPVRLLLPAEKRLGRILRLQLF